ncbi:MAG: ANTAR domain-containing protein [Thermoguttaceae bacterium]|nr:ANTAR domain-containing protein [Thermoguttaceae bacterium]
MSLKERTYRVLIVSAAADFNAVATALFPRSKFEAVVVASNVAQGKRLFAEQAFDFVVVNSPLPDDPGVQFAIDASESPATIAALLVRADLYLETCDKATDRGVFAVSKPISPDMMATALQWMTCARERLRKFEKKTLSLEEKIESIRFVNRAKWLLVSELKMEEADAHRYIEKQAMDRCVPKLEIAKEIVKTYS